MQTETLKFSGKMARQGDVLIFARTGAELKGKPETARTSERGQLVVARSTTGHHHVITGGRAELVEVDAFTSLLTVSEPATLSHLRSFDTHAPIEIPPGDYIVRRPREVTPEGLRRIED